MTDRDITNEKISTVAENSEAYLKNQKAFQENLDKLTKRFNKVVDGIKKDLEIK